MKEHPILFSGEMVRALLAGTKTQTRRTVKIPRDTGEFVLVEQDDGGWWPYKSEDGESPNVDNVEIPLNCPYGVPGDRLWVRESFCPNWSDRIIYKADGGSAKAAGYQTEPKWKPSIHMPRAASRITLEVTGIRVERLQDISEADAIAEGIEKSPSLARPGGYVWCDYNLPHDPAEWYASPIDSYKSLWESINGPGTWASNPWVWVIGFPAYQQAEAQ